MCSERGGDPRTFFGKLYGQEKNLTTASVARMNLLLHGIEDFAIERGDTLRNPVFTDSATGGLATFDCVIANPPFSLEQWGREMWENDPWGRAFAGLPTDSSGDFAWVQHMVTSMARGSGRMAVVLPQGALFRGGVEGQIRRKLLEQDLVEAVIGLAPNLFYGTGLAACILVLRQRKAPERRRQGADRRRVDALPQGPGAELPRPRARRDDPRLGAGLRRCRGPRHGRHARRDRGRGLDAQHLALRAAADRRRHPAAGRSDRRLQGRARAGARRPRRPAPRA